MKCFYCVAEKAEDRVAIFKLQDAQTKYNGTPVCDTHAAELLRQTIPTHLRVSKAKQ